MVEANTCSVKQNREISCLQGAKGTVLPYEHPARSSYTNEGLDNILAHLKENRKLILLMF